MGLSSGGFELDDTLLEGLACEVCRQQPAVKRLRMEAYTRRMLEELHRTLEEESLGPAERLELEAECQNAEVVLEELRKHRWHTPFFKVVARGRHGVGYRSIFDGRTSYVIGQRSSQAAGGCFVHPTLEDCEQSVASFPQASKAWSAPRTILAVRGEGSWTMRHGKVMFDMVTPLGELPCGPTESLRSSWRP